MAEVKLGPAGTPAKSTLEGVLLSNWRVANFREPSLSRAKSKGTKNSE